MKKYASCIAVLISLTSPAVAQDPEIFVEIKKYFVNDSDYNVVAIHPMPDGIIDRRTNLLSEPIPPKGAALVALEATELEEDSCSVEFISVTDNGNDSYSWYSGGCASQDGFVVFMNDEFTDEE